MLKVRSAYDSMSTLIMESDDFDDMCWNDQSGQTMKRIGRRIVKEERMYGTTEYKRYRTEQEAADAFEDARFPSTGDSVIYESFDRALEERYEIHFSDGYSDAHNDIQHAATREGAKALLEQMHEEHGEFQPSWFVSDYGTYEMIS